MPRVRAWLVGVMLVWAAPIAPAAPPTPILIELFTSEGCSDCPAADILLDKLVATQPVAGAEIIALAQHVDYWDRLGWKDRFSSAAFTNRQQVYGATFGAGNIYTPQMVVDGIAEFVGSDRHAAERAISKSLAAPHGSVSIKVEPPRGNHLVVSVSARDLPTPGRGDHADIIIAVTEDHLKTDVKHGENHGRTLRHTAVVRELRSIGEVTAEESTTARGDVLLAPDWQRDSIKIVAFVQERRGRRVLAAGSVPIKTAVP